MNALKVITLAAVAACGSTNLVGYNGLNHLAYNGVHGYNGLHGYAASPVAYSAAVAPATVAPAYNNYVAPYAAPYAPIQSQYHSQDELGQYSFGYSGGPSNRAETRDAYGNVRGSYNYIDSNGQTQTQHYVADALGFRVSGTNLPVGPSAPAVPVTAALVAPVPVVDTPEVVQAREEFLALYNEAAAAAAAAPDTDIYARKKRSIGSVAIHSAVAPLSYSGIHRGYSGLVGNHGLIGHHGLVGHQGLLGHHGVVGHHGLIGHNSHIAGYAGLGLNTPAATYAGLPTLGYSAAPAVTYGAAPAVAHVAAPAVAHAVAPAAVHNAELLRVENNPGHAVSYRVY